MPVSEVVRLRALLADAAALASDLGDEARPEPAGVGYFADAGKSGIATAISEIAGHAREITMFVGAGVSMEAELPSWHTLVRKLLIGARRVGDDHDAVAAWADTVLQEGPLAAAAVAESLYRDGATFRRALRDALYERDPDSYVPGALAGQIAWLKQRLGSHLAILTVNYDGLLEGALAERGLDPASYVTGRSEPSGKSAVWHLHGRLIRASSRRSWQREGNLVLSEGSYVRSTASTFPQEFVAQCLRSTLCVFVGLSMTDPNFIRWLYNSAERPGGPRYVIFVRQAALVADQRVQDLLERSAAARWARYHVTPVWANYYGEVAQIIHEIGLRWGGGRASDFAVRSRQRLARGAARLSPPNVDDFADAQREASEWLRRRLANVRAICSAADPPVELSGHHLGLGLWAIDHDTGEIMNWASADRAYQEPDAVVRNPLHVRSRWVAAVAIANGVPVEEDPQVYASRWRFVRAIPIIVGPGGERSVVGAVTLTSMTPLHDFPLAKDKAPPGLLSAIDGFLVAQVGEFFEA
jgi:hypothetical protein